MNAKSVAYFIKPSPEVRAESTDKFWLANTN